MKKVTTSFSVRIQPLIVNHNLLVDLYETPRQLFHTADVGKRAAAIVAGVPGLSVCSQHSFYPGADYLPALHEALLVAMDCSSDILITSFKNDAMSATLDYLAEHRSRHGTVFFGGF